MAEIASGLVVNGVTEILKKLVPVVSQTIAGAWGVKGDLKKLKRTLEMILAVIADAERRQVNDEAVRLWLERLKDAAYDADNVLDEFSYEVMRRADQMTNLKDKVGNFIHYLSTFLVGFVSAWKLALLSVAVISGIAFFLWIVCLYSHWFNFQERESYGIVAKQLDYSQKINHQQLQ